MIGLELREQIDRDFQRISEVQPLSLESWV
jgi:hypothetical protein